MLSALHVLGLLQHRLCWGWASSRWVLRTQDTEWERVEGPRSLGANEKEPRGGALGKLRGGQSPNQGRCRPGSLRPCTAGPATVLHDLLFKPLYHHYLVTTHKKTKTR